MSMSFNQDSSWNLFPISSEEIIKEVHDLLIEDEIIEAAFKSLRDQLLFTNKRIIAIDILGITDKKKWFNTLPYSRIQYFSIQTPGFNELVPDCELNIVFANSFTAKFIFKGNTDIGSIGRLISKHVLD